MNSDQIRTQGELIRRETDQLIEMVNEKVAGFKGESVNPACHHVGMSEPTISSKSTDQHLDETRRDYIAEELRIVRTYLDLINEERQVAGCCSHIERLSIAINYLEGGSAI